MTALDIEREAQQAITLIKSFSLELHDYSPESQVLAWLNQYRAAWIRDAIIEAVYQGRYKIISVQHILAIWERRGQPVRHFTSGFEQVMASHLGAPIHMPTDVRSKSPGAGHGKSSYTAELSAEPFPLIYEAASTGTDASNYPDKQLLSSRSDYTAGLSIEAFPVEDVDTLVEVYQANVSTEETVAKATSTPTSSGLPSLSFELSKPRQEPPEHLQQSKVYAAAIGSMPIQPFRPNLSHRQSP